MSDSIPPFGWYLAASYTRRAEMQHHAADLTDRGQHVVCTWLDDTAYPPEDIAAVEAGSAPQIAAQHAQDDIRDLAACDIVVIFTETDGPSRGGRHVEYGVILGWAAMANTVANTPVGMQFAYLNKSICRVGPVENIFHTHTPEHLVFDTWAALLEAFDAAGRCEFVMRDEHGLAAWRCARHAWHAQIHLPADAFAPQAQPNREQRRANGHGKPGPLIVPSLVPPGDLR